MATYLIGSDPVTFSPVEELSADLARATDHRDRMVVVMAHDLRKTLAWVEDATDYIRRCASNCPEANELLKRVEPRS